MAIFAGLEALNDSSEETIVSLEEAFLEVVDADKARVELATEIEQLLSTAADLNQLYETITKTGITRSLLTMTNSTGVLSKNISGIPSLESFTRDLSVEASQEALDGIKTKIEELIKKAVSKIGNYLKDISTGFKVRARSIPAIHNRVEFLAKQIEGKQYNAEKAKSITGRFYKYGELIELIDAAIASFDVAEEFLKIKLPTSEDDFHEFKVTIKKLSIKHSDNYEFTDYYTRYKFKKSPNASLFDNGYTGAAFKTIASKLEEYVKKLMSSQNTFYAKLAAYEEESEALLHNVSAHNQIGVVIPFYTTASRVLYSAIYEASGIAFDIVWDAYSNGPGNAIKTLAVVRRAYV